MSALELILKRWPVFAFVAAAAMLAVAHAFETFGHLAPCHLCLKQREVYWAALAISAVGAATSFSPLPGHGRRVTAAVLAMLFAYGAYLAAYHAGAEWKWWPGPASCSGSAKVNLKDLSAFLHGAAGPQAPRCDQAPWVFLGLSMAGWNFVASLGLVALSTASALTRETKAR
jgi:disulfide bond formation protein DsbB